MSHATSTTAKEEHEAAHAGGHGVLQEPDAVPVGRVLRIGLWGVLVTVVAIWLSAIFLRQDEAIVPAPAAHTARLDEDTKDVGILELGMYSARGERPDGPAQKLKAEKEAQLRSYGWVDEKAGIIRIPIERAYDQVIDGYGKAK
jgi:hypothetical protein